MQHPRYLCLVRHTPPPEIYPLSLHAALPIFGRRPAEAREEAGHDRRVPRDRRSRVRIRSDPIDSGIARNLRSRGTRRSRSEEHTSELQSLTNLVCRLLLEKKNSKTVNCSSST